MLVLWFFVLAAKHNCVFASPEAPNAGPTVGMLAPLQKHAPPLELHDTMCSSMTHYAIARYDRAHDAISL